jgi:outer membrane receptor protein involved in Fe transport
MSYSKFGAGIYTEYNSAIKNMDVFFITAIKGLQKDDYWIKYSEGFVTDLRLSYKIAETADVSLFCQNIRNEEYMEAPGNTNTPRQFVLQIIAQF